MTFGLNAAQDSELSHASQLIIKAERKHTWSTEIAPWIWKTL